MFYTNDFLSLTRSVFYVFANYSFPARTIVRDSCFAHTTTGDLIRDEAQKIIILFFE